MDSKFLKFWGQFLLNVAEGQSQLEQMSAWMEKGFTGVSEMAVLFQRFYGLEAPTASKSQDSEAEQWQKAIAEFQKSLASFSLQWGWIPEKQYLQLKKDHIRLQQQVEQQEETITTLRALLDDKGMSHMELLQQLQNLTNEQNRQFQDLMKSLRLS